MCSMNRHRYLIVVALLSWLLPAAAEEPTAEDAAKIVAAVHLKKSAEFQARGRLGPAEHELDLAIISYPDGATLYSARGEVRHLRKNYPAAIQDFDVYLAKVPDDSRIVFLRGIAKSLLKPEDVAGSCADILRAKSLGFPMDNITGLDKYCLAQPGWDDN